MSHQYTSVQWNHKKVVYDLWLWFGMIMYIGTYLGISFGSHTGADALSPMILLIRAFATLAFLMLTLILCIGPLARIDSRFLPLLYNRRHFGVSMFLMALTHGILATLWYHGFGVESPLASIFSRPDEINSFADIPFQPFGFAALLILLLMAATSHDFWNTNLGPTLWKSIHMSIYLAYSLVVIHLAVGAMQAADTGIHPLMVASSVVSVSALHLIAGQREAALDRPIAANDWLDVGAVFDIDNNRAKIVTLANQDRVAVFRYDENHIAAVGNACKHQGGPLGEGKVIDGCITCPWHGFQYRPEDGCSPPPYNEKIPTYRVRLEGERILLHPEPLPDGTPREVAIIGVPS